MIEPAGVRRPRSLAHFTGLAGSEPRSAALPQFGGVRVDSTRLQIDRKGRLREIHAGWAGPATAQLQRKVARKPDTRVTALLQEPA